MRKVMKRESKYVQYYTIFFLHILIFYSNFIKHNDNDTKDDETYVILIKFINKVSFIYVPCLTQPSSILITERYTLRDESIAYKRIALIKETFALARDRFLSRKLRGFFFYATNRLQFDVINYLKFPPDTLNIKCRR